MSKERVLIISRIFFLDFFDEQQKKQNTLITYSHLSIYIQFETPL